MMSGYLLIKTVLDNNNVPHTNTERHAVLSVAKECAFQTARVLANATLPYRILVVDESVPNGDTAELELYRGEALKPLNRRELRLQPK